MSAVNGGARVNPGQFWDLSGTFLFTVYVMTALGFGAPVPHTTWGRTSAVIYAMFAVPAHIYLMLNASMCLVVRVEKYFKQLRCSFGDNKSFDFKETTLHNGSAANLLREQKQFCCLCSRTVNKRDNGSRSSEVWKVSDIIIRRFLSVIGAYRGVPVIAVIYYVCGAAAFGLARGNSSIDTVLFPLEFTTSGGLDRISGHIRILYGWYVEGAMMLLSCGLATLRRYSGAAVSSVATKYRLFESEK